MGREKHGVESLELETGEELMFHRFCGEHREKEAERTRREEWSELGSRLEEAAKIFPA